MVIAAHVCRSSVLSSDSSVWLEGLSAVSVRDRLTDGNNPTFSATSVPTGGGTMEVDLPTESEQADHSVAEEQKDFVSHLTLSNKQVCRIVVLVIFQVF